jgi:Cytochrome P450
MSIRAIFYYLIKTPQAYQKLREEIDQAIRVGKLSHIVEHQQALELPYLFVLHRKPALDWSRSNNL